MSLARFSDHAHFPSDAFPAVIFLEAVTSTVAILPPETISSRDESQALLHILPSDEERILWIQLRSQDVFRIGKTVLTLQIQEVEVTQSIADEVPRDIAGSNIDTLYENTDCQEVFCGVRAQSRPERARNTNAQDYSKQDAFPDEETRLVPANPNLDNNDTQNSVRRDGDMLLEAAGVESQQTDDLCDQRKDVCMEDDLEQDSMESTIQVQPSSKTKRELVATPLGRRRSESSHQSTEASHTSTRTTRPIAEADLDSLSSSTDSRARILFASSTDVDTFPRHMKFLQKHGAKKADSMDTCTMLCVGKGAELKRTGKLVLAIAGGKDVVNDEWITASFKEGRLLDPRDYLAKDPVREKQWGIKLDEAVERGREGRKALLGEKIVFTRSIKKELGKGFVELKEIALYAGAESVQICPSFKKAKDLAGSVVIASEGDNDLLALKDISVRVYSKDIITLSVLRGFIDLKSDEFLIDLSRGSQESGSRKRKR